MAQFIRFMRGATLDEARANAQADLERGYSYRVYALFESRAAALASDFVQHFGVDPDTCVVLPDGRWGFALEGLCGYAHEDDDEGDLAGYGYADGYSFVARYEGRYVGETDAGDGDVFRPLALLGVEALP